MGTNMQKNGNDAWHWSALKGEVGILIGKKRRMSDQHIEKEYYEVAGGSSDIKAGYGGQARVLDLPLNLKIMRIEGFLRFVKSTVSSTNAKSIGI